jgi:hypothetical protein
MDTGCRQAVSPRNQIDELAQFQCFAKVGLTALLRFGEPGE